MEAELVALFGGGVAGQWLTKVVGPTLEDFAQDLKTWVRNKRGKNAQAVVTQAIEMTAGKEVHQVPTRVFVPLLTAAANEDEPDLQRRWAALLAAAAINPDQVPSSFTGILASLSPMEVETFDYVYLRSGYVRRAVHMGETSISKSDSFIASMNNLERLGLLRPSMDPDLNRHGIGANVVTMPKPDLLPTYAYVKITDLGLAFIIACHAPGEAVRRQREYEM
jgi:hypothetical protein